MLEIRKTAKSVYKEMIDRGISESSARWAVLDAASILLSLEKGHWIRLNPMSEEVDRGIPDCLLEIDWLDVDPRCLAWVYSDLMDPQTKVKTASIYTPDSVVRFMVRSALSLSIKDSCGLSIEEEFDGCKESALSILRAVSKLTIADPCVGCGLFLYEAWIQLCEIEDQMTAIVDPNKLKSKSTRVVSLDQLHGVDINPEAIEISKRLLQFAWRATKR